MLLYESIVIVPLRLVQLSKHVYALSFINLKLQSMKDFTLSLWGVILSMLMLPFVSYAYTLENIQVGTTTRTMLTYVPANLAANRPLVISMHGSNQDAAYQKDHSMMEEVSDTAKFAVVYPNAVNKNWDLSGTSDINFILTIIDTMVIRNKIDRNRVYLSGFSMGGMMTYFAATKIADKIAAFAPISGYLMGGPNTNSSRPTPIIHTHGTGDDVVAFSGVQTCINAWVTRNGCKTPEVVTKPYPASNQNSVGIKHYYAAGTNAVEMVLMELTGKGHWYSDDAANVMTSIEIWNFCKKYSLFTGKPVVSITAPLSNASILADNSTFTETQSISVSATATDPDGTVSSVSFYNGSTLLFTDTEAPYAFNWNNVAVGTYTLKAVATDNENKTEETSMTVQVKAPTGPAISSAHPENNSFDLPNSINTFEFKFTQQVNASIAKGLVINNSDTTNLAFEQSGLTDTLTCKLPVGKTLIDGKYKLMFENLKNALGVPANEVQSISFVVGTSGTGSAIDTVFMPDLKADNKSEGIPYGWKRVAGTDVAESGATGMGGSRLKHFLDGGDFNAGFYISPRGGSDACKIMYGTYDSLLNAQSVKQDFRLKLEPGNYTISFNSAYWNTGASDNKRTLDFNMMDVSSNVILSKTGLACAANLNENANQVVSGTQHHEFSFTITGSETKNYILEWSIPTSAGWNGLLFGGVKLTKVSSIAAQCKDKLAAALLNANTLLASTDTVLYRGAYRNSLHSTIQTYTAFSNTAPSAYDNAVNLVKAAVTTMLNHKTKVDSYLTSLASAQERIELYAGQTKYESLEAYPKLVQAVSRFGQVDYNNETVMQLASDSLVYYTSILNNTLDAVPILTYRLNKGVALARNLKIPVPENNLTDALAAIVDDDNVANSLNSTVREYVEMNISIDSIKFKANASNTALAGLTDSLDLTCFIKNPNFYTTSKTVEMSTGAFPGWTHSSFTAEADVTLQPIATDLLPVVDSWVCVLNKTIDYFEQTVSNVPAGIYDIGIKSRRASGTVTDQQLLDNIYMYVKQGDVTLKKPLTLESARALPSSQNTWIRNVKLGKGDSFTLGVTFKLVTGYEPTVFFGDAVMYMVSKNAEAYTGIDPVSVVTKVQDIQYYNMQGLKLNSPIKGLNIVKTIYQDGSTSIQKIQFN
jgi:poly(3-hydroxybutyrate) depolymerase